MRTQTAILREKRELQEQLNALEAEEQEYLKLTPLQRLADALHSATCHHNHTDACGWTYEDNTAYRNPNTTRGRYLKRATKLVADTRVEITTLIQVVSAL